MVKGLTTIICEVADMDRSVAFYRDTFGCTFETQTPFWSSFELAGTRIGLHPAFSNSGSATGGGWILGVEVDDLRAFKQSLVGRGTAVGEYHDVPGGVVLDFSDLDSNRLQAMQRGAKVADLL
jgi:predicted enzyme related to lactoylglutathione lyase